MAPPTMSWMSEQRRPARPGVYTMPPGAFRVGGTAEPQESVPSASAPPESVPSASPRSASVPRRRRRVWDVVLTIVLLPVGAAVSAAGSVWALLLAFLADGCGPVGCDYGRMNLGVWTAFSGPLAVWIVVLAVSVVLLAFRRLAFWVPLAGMALSAAVWALGAWLTATGAG